jgi:hypothetical protein
VEEGDQADEDVGSEGHGTPFGRGRGRGRVGRVDSILHERRVARRPRLKSVRRTP